MIQRLLYKFGYIKPRIMPAAVALEGIIARMAKGDAENGTAEVQFSSGNSLFLAVLIQPTVKERVSYGPTNN